jgi:hypothetical protein
MRAILRMRAVRAVQSRLKLTRRIVVPHRVETLLVDVFFRERVQLRFFSEFFPRYQNEPASSHMKEEKEKGD